LPALWPACALAAGILLERGVPLRPNATAALAIAALLAGLLLLRRSVRGGGPLRAAWISGLVVWVALGALAGALQRRNVAADNAAALIRAGRLETSEPLRWRGRLRQGPSRLPSGIRYDVDLDEVEISGQRRAVSGGLRATLYELPSRAWVEPPAVQPGDRIELLLRAHIPRNYMDPGAYDERGALERQGIQLIGALRDGSLLTVLGRPGTRVSVCFARLRNRLLATLDALFSGAPETAAVLRAMLLGDRGFLQLPVAEKFQQTAVFHVLVLAGLHVAALAGFVIWLTRRLRFRPESTILLTLVVLGCYVLIVEDRPPILRAALMAALLLVAGIFYRLPTLLNTLGAAVSMILCANPRALFDPSFHLSIAAVGAVGALALPLLQRTTGAYAPALRNLGDETRDPNYPPQHSQLRVLLRDLAADHGWRLPQPLQAHALEIVAGTVRIGFVIWNLLVISTVIQAGMLPLLALYFHRVALAGPLANLPALTLTGVIVPLGFFCLAVGSVALTLAAPLAQLLRGLVALLLATVSGFAAIPHLSYRVPGPPGWLLAICALAFAGLGVCAWRGATTQAQEGRRRSVRLRGATHVFAVLTAAVLLCVAIYPFAPRLAHGRLEATVLDVGQGDSIFVSFPDDRTLLVDGGGSALAPFERRSGRPEFDVGEQVVAPYLWERGLKHLDALALTHPDRDHMDGLYAVLEDFAVCELWVGREAPLPALRALEEEAAAHGVRIVHHGRGSNFDWGGARGEFLWPTNQLSTQKPSNNDSLVLRLEFAGVRYLLPGDIERPTEHELLARNDDLRADFLKVAHHGSRTSTAPPFLAAVAPSIAAISAGVENPYGHPSPAVLDEFRGRGARVVRTDRDGAATVSTDGRSLSLRTFAQEHPQQ
jgi:competence protein ComEC